MVRGDLIVCGAFHSGTDQPLGTSLWVEYLPLNDSPYEQTENRGYLTQNFAEPTTFFQRGMAGLKVCLHNFPSSLLIPSSLRSPLTRSSTASLFSLSGSMRSASCTLRCYFAIVFISNHSLSTSRIFCPVYSRMCFYHHVLVHLT